MALIILVLFIFVMIENIKSDNSWKYGEVREMCACDSFGLCLSINMFDV